MGSIQWTTINDLPVLEVVEILAILASPRLHA
jgi:hypothetical protein